VGDGGFAGVLFGRDSLLAQTKHRQSSVAHFCAKENTFAAPSTFPTAHTGEEYAEAHSHVMASLTDLGIQHFDVVVAKGSYFRSCLIAD